MRFLRRLARAVTEVDGATISLTSALRCGALELVLLATAVATDRLAHLVPAAVGLLFVCMCDPPGSEAHRDRAMAWFALWATLVMFIAGAVSEAPVAHLLAGVVVALLAGYVGVLGAVGQLNGTLVLVVFSIFAGTPVTRDATPMDAIALGVAAAIGGLVIAAPRVLHRARGPRAAFARIVRGFARVVVTDLLSMGAAAHIVHEREFAEITAAEDLTDPARAWFVRLGEAAHRGRLAMLGLSTEVARMPGESRADDRDRALAFLRAVNHGWRMAGATIVWRVRRRALVRARAAVTPAYDAFVAGADPIAARVASNLLDALDSVIALLLGDWPVGDATPRAQRPDHPSAGQRLATARRTLRTHLSPSDPFFRHAVRLAAAFTLATVLSEGLDLPHAYWLPMTVAWINKPAMGDTTVRVTARMSGTVIGVAVSAAVLGGTDPGSWVLAVLIAASTVVVIAFLFANYTVAVTGITCFVFFLFLLEGTITNSSFSGRLLATLLAGVIVLIGTYFWPTRAGDQIDSSLASYADALGAYAGPVLDGTADAVADGEAARERVADARIHATAVVRAAELEVSRHRLHPETAHALLEYLHHATSRSLATELAGPGAVDSDASTAVVGELADLRGRLEVVATGAPVPPRAHPPEVDHPVHQSVRLAHRALDDDAERHARAGRRHPGNADQTKR
ncbi:MAG: FUSC family protein [Actinomycetota bacterium]